MLFVFIPPRHVEQSLVRYPLKPVVAVLKKVFKSLDGFDEIFRDRSEFGTRLREREYNILLYKQVLVTHLKHWTIFKWLRCGITVRAVP